MFHTLKSRAKAHKALIAAVTVSLLMHTLLLSEFSFTLPAMDTDRQPINVHLVQTTAPILASKPIAKIAAKPKAKAAETTNVEHVNAESTESAENISTPAEDEIDFPTANEIAAPAKPTEPVAEKPNDAPMPPEPSPPEQTAATITPQYIETEFEVFQGESKSAVGTARITFNIDKSANYVIKSVIEAQGFTALFFQNLMQESQGVVTEHGLKPNYYSYRYGNKKSQTANFDWNGGTLTLRTEKGEKTEKLESGTQDLLSFMYQFMFTAPLGTNAINITNGKNLRNYNYRFLGEEIIYSKIGALNTIHLIKNSTSEEKTELWLATDYKNLPIKIRKTEKNGSVIEQVITQINTTPALNSPKPDIIW